MEVAHEAKARSPSSNPASLVCLCLEKGRICCGPFLWLKQDRNDPWETAFSEIWRTQNKPTGYQSPSSGGGGEIGLRCHWKTSSATAGEEEEGKWEGVHRAGGTGAPTLRKGADEKGWVLGSQNISTCGWKRKVALADSLKAPALPELQWPWKHTAPCSLLIVCGLRGKLLHYLHTSLTHTATGLKCFKTYISEFAWLRKYSLGRIAELD